MDNLAVLLNSINPLCEKTMQEVQNRLDNLTKPVGSLAALEEMAKQYAGALREIRPNMPHKALLVVTEVATVQNNTVSSVNINKMVEKIYCVLAEHAQAQLEFVSSASVISQYRDIEVTDIKQLIDFGVTIACKFSEQAITLIGLTKYDDKIAETCTEYKAKEAVRSEFIQYVLQNTVIDKENIYSSLARYQTEKVAIMLGLILGACSRRMIVILDGQETALAGVLACRLNPVCQNYLVASQLTGEPFHAELLNIMGIRPRLKLNIAAEKGMGAVLGLTLVDAGLKVLNEMATFAEARVAYALDDFNNNI